MYTLKTISLITRIEFIINIRKKHIGIRTFFFISRGTAASTCVFNLFFRQPRPCSIELPSISNRYLYIHKVPKSFYKFFHLHFDGLRRCFASSLSLCRLVLLVVTFINVNLVWQWNSICDIATDEFYLQSWFSFCIANNYLYPSSNSVFGAGFFAVFRIRWCHAKFPFDNDIGDWKLIHLTRFLDAT